MTCNVFYLPGKSSIKIWPPLIMVAMEILILKSFPTMFFEILFILLLNIKLFYFDLKLDSVDISEHNILINKTK